MVAVESTMLPLGTPAPDFALPDPSGQVHTLAGVAAGSSALVVAFICNHCPYVKLIADRFAELGNELRSNGVAVVAINSNDASAHPDDSPEAMATEVELRGYRFPYLFDESQQTARDYHAACTPDFFIFGADLKLRYRGRFDSARPGNAEQVTGAELAAAAAAIAAGGEPSEPQVPSMGCNIKWRPGSEPAWFG
jgi:peroxiredoxin